ncbi:polysaccharide lyase 6 family protein [Microlunatus sp. GCM10028923]|uniref:polysaccharide lyase 6 family protein n=1 Tax=Microlunatus sp. GCM10028923 TaxID=3273400 RepID=UPI00360C530C
MQRRTFLAACGVAAGTAGSMITGTARAADAVRVDSVDALRRAIAEARPGSVIVLADGSYPVPAGAPVAITGRHGTAQEPITIKAASVGGVELTGEQSFELTDSSHLVINGFVFRQSTTLEVPADCHHVRLSRNTFRLADLEGLHWVMIRGDHSVVDHNSFAGKSTLGIFLGVEGGAGADVMAQGVKITRNHFTDHTFTGSNGGEPIRLGLSGRALGDAGALVELNLFERVDGDPEAISVKSSGNLIRHNTVRDSLGGIVLRHGNNTRVEANHLLGGRNGIRIYGDDHLVINNYLHGIAGSGIVLGSGSVRDHLPGESPESRRGNDAPDRVTLAHNTVIDCGTGISGESQRTLPPLDCVLADNVLVGAAGSLTNLPFQDGTAWAGNLFWGAALDGTAPAGGFRRADPLLAAGPDGVHRLTQGSPAIGAASRRHPGVDHDLDGDERGRTRDVGADEYTTGPPRFRPLTAADVGPLAR